MAQMTERELLLFSMLDVWSKMMRNAALELSPDQPPQFSDWSGLCQAAQGIADELEASALLYTAQFQRDYACEQLIQIRGRLQEAMNLFRIHQEMCRRHAPVVPIK